jgi:RNA polymerase sigma-70 factor (ECF subfamily)
MFTADAVWEMPPTLAWYRGPERIGELIATRCPGGRHDMRLLPTNANAQPAFGLYMRGPDGAFWPFQLHVLSLRGSRIGHVVAFRDSTLFATFGLPPHLPATAG